LRVLQITIPFRLTTSDFERAKAAAPGWDVHHIEGQWQDWIADKEKPKNPDAAFIAFCGKKYQGKGCLDRNGSKRAQKPRG
jgi:hypothetical protein